MSATSSKPIRRRIRRTPTTQLSHRFDEAETAYMAQVFRQFLSQNKEPADRITFPGGVRYRVTPFCLNEKAPFYIEVKLTRNWYVPVGKGADSYLFQQVVLLAKAHEWNFDDEDIVARICAALKVEKKLHVEDAPTRIHTIIWEAPLYTAEAVVALGDKYSVTMKQLENLSAKFNKACNNSVANHQQNADSNGAGATAIRTDILRLQRQFSQLETMTQQQPSPSCNVKPAIQGSNHHMKNENAPPIHHPPTCEQATLAETTPGKAGTSPTVSSHSGSNMASTNTAMHLDSGTDSPYKVENVTILYQRSSEWSYMTDAQGQAWGRGEICLEGSSMVFTDKIHTMNVDITPEMNVSQVLTVANARGPRKVLVITADVEIDNETKEGEMHGIRGTPSAIDGLQEQLQNLIETMISRLSLSPLGVPIASLSPLGVIGTTGMTTTDMAVADMAVADMAVDDTAVEDKSDMKTALPYLLELTQLTEAAMNELDLDFMMMGNIEKLQTYLHKSFGYDRQLGAPSPIQIPHMKVCIKYLQDRAMSHGNNVFVSDLLELPRNNSDILSQSVNNAADYALSVHIIHWKGHFLIAMAVRCKAIDLDEFQDGKPLMILVESLKEHTSSKRAMRDFCHDVDVGLWISTSFERHYQQQTNACGVVAIMKTALIIDRYEANELFVERASDTVSASFTIGPDTDQSRWTIQARLLLQGLVSNADMDFSHALGEFLLSPMAFTITFPTKQAKEASLMKSKKLAAQAKEKAGRKNSCK